MKREDLNKVLEQHKLWLDTEGEQGERADLQDANLRYANLRNVDLQDANLSDANLRYADLRYTNLRGANLRHANLRYTNLRGANLRYTNLRGANLRGANLHNAALRGANLRHANLHNAALRGANLHNAALRGANLRHANLSGVRLWDATGNGKEIKTIQTEKYTINICGEQIQIGCKNYTCEQWMRFSDNKISKMDDGALEWWKQHKSMVECIYNTTKEQ